MKDDYYIPLFHGKSKRKSMLSEYAVHGSILKTFNIDPEKYMAIKDLEEKNDFVRSQTTSHMV